MMYVELKTHIDDEYARAGIQDPKILLTTSRDASRCTPVLTSPSHLVPSLTVSCWFVMYHCSRLTAFVKELRLIFPNSQRINRGNTITKVSPYTSGSAT
jgi:U3 small nucleolar ribonucleoprotein protein IMP4